MSAARSVHGCSGHSRRPSVRIGAAAGTLTLPPSPWPLFRLQFSRWPGCEDCPSPNPPPRLSLDEHRSAQADFVPGPGTYERGADICASLLGTRAVTQPEASAADKVVSGMRCMRFHLSASTPIDQPLPCTGCAAQLFRKARMVSVSLQRLSPGEGVEIMPATRRQRSERKIPASLQRPIVERHEPWSAADRAQGRRRRDRQGPWLLRHPPFPGSLA